MRVHLASIKATAAMMAARCMEMTPEVLAATGARYSRSGEGVEKIFEITQGKTDDQAVDSIFKMVDYGHASIADMAPVPIFMDRISMYLVMKIWQWCSTASGQETSTRYVSIKEHDTIMDRDEYRGLMTGAQCIQDGFSAYQRSLDLWTEIAGIEPELIGMPAEYTQLPETPKEQADIDDLDADVFKSMKTRDRLVRNFAFDRSRYYLPMGAYTNFMMVMSARSWVELVVRLLSSRLREANELGQEITKKLALVVPKLVKHAKFSAHVAEMMEQDWQMTVETWPAKDSANLTFNYREPSPFCHITGPETMMSDEAITNLCKNHGNRYTGFTEALGQLSVRYGWMGLPLAETRDMNRHRPGSKYFPLSPVGFYAADDEISRVKALQYHQALSDLTHVGDSMIKYALAREAYGDSPYWMPLGMQLNYSHNTTADKFLYMCELRTGRGAHPQYARRVREVLEIWHTAFPGTRQYVRPGTAEPE